MATKLEYPELHPHPKPNPNGPCPPRQRAHDAKITSLSRQNDVATFWRYNDVIIASCARWDVFYNTGPPPPWSEDTDTRFSARDADRSRVETGQGPSRLGILVRLSKVYSAFRHNPQQNNYVVSSYPCLPGHPDRKWRPVPLPVSFLPLQPTTLTILYKPRSILSLGRGPLFNGSPEVTLARHHPVPGNEPELVNNQILCCST